MEKLRSSSIVICLIALPLLLLTAIALYSRNPVTAPFFERWSLNRRHSAAAAAAAAAASGQERASPPPTNNYATTILSPSPAPSPAGNWRPSIVIAANDDDDDDHNQDEKLLNGLLAAGFDEDSCLSRYQSYLLYRKPSPHTPTPTPSPSLIAKLRRYEALHRKCGPGSRPYRKTIQPLAAKSKTIFSNRRRRRQHPEECRYLVWLPANGLGNRMISLASTFLYALLTHRILLVELPSDMSGLFCQPFLNTTWESPTRFSLRREIGVPNYQDIINMAHHKNNTTTTMPVEQQSQSSSPSPDVFDDVVVFLDLQHHSREEPELYFHCNDGQDILNRVPVLVLRSDQYFVPSLFMTPYFRDDLNQMFPEKETVFHFLGRYLLHPTNEAWGLITRFYEAYLAKADRRIGLQVRLFNPKLTPKQTVMDQILSCTLNNHILPELANPSMEYNHHHNHNNQTLNAVLVASLYPDFSENLRTMYWSKPTKTGELVQVFQPTHEGAQRFNNGTHEVKALVEMYLLSLCDVLVTSAQSTFGYVAQGLAGLKPWIMGKTVGDKFQHPACNRASSIEPCFHFPPHYDCAANKKVDHITSAYHHMTKCTDWSFGVNMVDQEEDQHSNSSIH